MEKNKFDQYIKDQLEGIKEQYDEQTWLSMSEQLEKINSQITETDGEEIIPAVRDKMNSHQEEFRQEHWDDMSERLAIIKEKNKQLVISKVFELIIIAFIILTFYNYQHDQSPQAIKGEHAVLNSHNNTSTNVVVPLLPFQSVLKVATDNNSDLISSFIDTEETIDIMKSSEVVLSPTKKDIIDNEKKNSVDHQQIPILDPSVLDPLPLVIPHRSIESKPVAVLMDDKLNKSESYSVAVSMSQDINTINSPLDFDALSSGVRNGISGASVAFLGYYQKRSWQLSSGLRWSQKDYTPQLIKSFTKAGSNKYVEAEVEHISFSQLQIPLAIRYYFPNQSKSNLYIHAGMAFNAVLDYEYQTALSVAPTSRVASLSTQIPINVGQLPIGLAERGEWSNNFYYSSFTGIGVETKIDLHNSFFFHTQYQFTVGPGANRFIEDVKTFSFEGGLRFSF